MIKAIPYTSLWFGSIVWFLLGGGFLSATVYVLYQDFLFAEYPKSVQGTVERKYYHASHGRHGTNYTPHLVYRYQTPGLTFTTDRDVTRETYAEVAVGGPVPVVYVDGKADDNRVDTTAERRKIEYVSYGVTAATLAIGIIGGFVLRFYLRQNKLYRDLLASGAQTTGIVIAVDFDLVGKARTQRYYALFTFRDNQGREISGKSWYIKPGEEYRWKATSPIRVYYDPRDSGKFTVDLTGPTTNPT